MLAKIASVTHCGLEGHHVEIETDLANSLPGMSIIGLVGKSVDEAKERIKSAIKNSSLNYPAKRITISLAPADIPKQGSHFDLAMAVGILAASGQIPKPDPSWLFYGELSLDGFTRPTHGVISAAVYAKENNIRKLFVSADNAAQAAAINGVEVYAVDNLYSLYKHLIGEKTIAQVSVSNLKLDTNTESPFDAIELDDIYGQHAAKRALVIAIAGNHNIIMSGTPGGGKTMLARAAASLLPIPSKGEMIETTRIYSLAGLLKEEIMARRPFRSPHHSISHIGLVGGGQNPRPGEISLAHNGVLFLDEFAEFSRQSLETLRQPIEEGTITISRAQANVAFPANFLLIATHNPCPCGYLNDEEQSCNCSPAAISRYQQKLSGPLLDRIDLKIWVKRLSAADLSSKPKPRLTSLRAKEAIIAARQIQDERFKKDIYKTNGKMDNKSVKKYCNLNNDTQMLLNQAVDQLRLSARSHMKILKVSRTIADLDNSQSIELKHLSEALQYR